MFEFLRPELRTSFYESTREDLMRHRSILAPLFIATIFIVGGTTAGTASASHEPLVAYCSPTGDVCQGVFPEKGGLRAKVSTFSFSGTYQLCVTNRAYGRQCKKFRVRKDDLGVFQGSVRLARHFRFREKGRYSIVWRLRGNRIGKKLSFRKE